MQGVTAGVPRTQRAAPLSSQAKVTDPFPSEKSAAPTAASAALMGAASAARAALPEVLAVLPGAGSRLRFGQSLCQ
eukprot:2856019-Pleurochrysis_carterae.AAC.1